MRIGILNDRSGPYADYQGPGSFLAAQMAVEDYGGNVAGRKIEVISADHQNKVDIGTNITRKWFESEGVDAIFDVPNSSIAFAISDLASEKTRLSSPLAPAATRLPEPNARAERQLSKEKSS